MKIEATGVEGALTGGQRSDLLQGRIASNRAAQKVDLVDWIFERVRVSESDWILELCCGTGSQTVRFLQGAVAGRVVALDVAEESLKVLRDKAASYPAQNLVTLQGDMDELSTVLERVSLQPPCFDLVFCAYGLYYSRDALKTLQELKRWLKPGGRIAIVGPFGPNNSALFSLLEKGGVVVSDEILFTSRDFMWETVFPWASRHYEKIQIHTLRNEVSWRNPEEVMAYWRNTIFYDVDRSAAVRALLEEHFKRQELFVNDKWIMLLEMGNARP